MADNELMTGRNEDVTNDKEPLGDKGDDPRTLAIDSDVVEKIVAITCRSVDGILQMKGNFLTSIQEGFGGTDITKGVQVEMVGDDACTVNVSIIMEYGKSAKKIFSELHDRITEKITDMTGLRVNAVNVRVVNVMTREELDGGRRPDKKTKDRDRAEKGKDGDDEATLADVPTAELVERFDDLQRGVFSYQYAQQVISYDGETVGPEKGVAARSEAIGELAGREHEAAFGPQAVALVGELARRSDELDELHSAELRVYRRDVDEMGRIPAQECAAFSKLTTEAVDVWKRAKAASDYSLFEPYVERIVDSLKRQAAYLDSDRDPYDVWLDQYERGMDRAAVESFFAQVQAGIVPVVEAIQAKGWQPDDSFLHRPVPLDQQRELCQRIAPMMGLDTDALAMGETEHPFTDGFSHGDVRIANHFFENNVASAVFSMIHEGGHALYEQGIDPAYDYTCLRGGVSMGVHESQSRFMENVVARSEAFCAALLPVMQQCCPGTFDDVDAHALYEAVCRSECSLIRTEADELTYPLHILVRFEVEKALFDGTCTAHDAPALWNELMKRYLGVDVPDDAHGILQDTHWSGGSFAYFPSYAIGSAYAAQLMDVMRTQVDVDAAEAAGDLRPINAWLRERIWRHGSAKDPAELIEAACGAPFDASHYVDYLVNKYQAVYGL